MKKLYAAYGSNLNLYQMSVRCPDSQPVSKGIIAGYRLTFRGNARFTGVANIEPRTGSTVPVGLFEITRGDERELDRYEGYPRLYTKIQLPVVLDNGETIKAMVYVMTPGHTYAPPSRYYLNVIREGYFDFGFSSRNLIYAATHPLKGVNV